MDEDVNVETGVVTPEAESSAAPPPEAVTEAPPSGQANLPGWVQPRIGMLTRERHEAMERARAAEAKAAAAEAALAELTAGAPAAPKTPPATDRRLTLEEAEAYAEQKAANLRFRQQTDEVYLKGKELFKESFDQSLANLGNVGFGNNQASKNLIEAAIATGKAPEVLTELSKDLNTAGRILQLPPVAMAVELASMAKTRPAAPGVSRAPEPVPSRVSGAGAGAAPTLYDTERMSTREWIEQRNKSARKRRR